MFVLYSDYILIRLNYNYLVFNIKIASKLNITINISF